MSKQNNSQDLTAEKLSQINLIKRRYFEKMKKLNRKKIEILKKYDDKLKELSVTQIRKNLKEK